MPAPAEDPVRRGGYSVRDLSLRWRVGPDKVRAFIRSGELVAVNVAAHLSSKPQWRVTPESVQAFECRRTSAPPPKLARRKRRSAYVDYFPDLL
jgi:hypothetical protein